MKRMIISPAQLKVINEAALGTVTYDSSTGPNAFRDALANVQTNITKPIALTDISSDPGVNNGTSTIPGGVEAAKKTTTSPETRTTIITPDSPMSESRFSKRQVELGRMLEMRRTGKVFSKKQLNEMFMETQDNVKRLEGGLGNCLIFNIFEAVAKVFGPEVEEEMKERLSKGEDPTMTINDIFSREESEKQEEFLNALGI